MQVLAIVALVFAGISIFVPVLGVFMAMACSLMAMISFRNAIGLSSVVFGVNILNTVFWSPSILVHGYNNHAAAQTAPTMVEAYWPYVAVHVVALFAAVIWRRVKGPLES